MRIQIQLVAIIAVMCLAGCASSSFKKTWKSPSYQSGPVQKVALLAVDERGLVRTGFENRLLRELGAAGQAAVVTHEMLNLPDIKVNKEAAAGAMRGAGADSVLIVRLVDQVTYNRQVEARPEAYVPVTTGIDSFYSYGWYDYYTVAFMDMGASWSNTKQQVYLDSSLYELKSGQRLWSALTLTTIKEDTDRLVEADKLTAKVVNALRKDGLVK